MPTSVPCSQPVTSYQMKAHCGRSSKTFDGNVTILAGRRDRIVGYLDLFGALASAGFETAGYPGIFYLGHGHPIVTDSTLN
jgi:hypothetical protein